MFRLYVSGCHHCTVIPPSTVRACPTIWLAAGLQSHSTVEAISGRHVHKQNFRRLVEGSAIVEPTGAVSLKTGGRPAALFQFRRNVLQERPAPGLRVGIRS